MQAIPDGVIWPKALRDTRDPVVVAETSLHLLRIDTRFIAPFDEVLGAAYLNYCNEMVSELQHIIVDSIRYPNRNSNLIDDKYSGRSSDPSSSCIASRLFYVFER